MVSSFHNQTSLANVFRCLQKIRIWSFTVYSASRVSIFGERSEPPEKAPASGEATRGGGFFPRSHVTTRNSPKWRACSQVALYTSFCQCLTFCWFSFNTVSYFSTSCLISTSWARSLFSSCSTDSSSFLKPSRDSSIADISCCAYKVKILSFVLKRKVC